MHAHVREQTHSRGKLPWQHFVGIRSVLGIDLAGWACAVGFLLGKLPEFSMGNDSQQGQCSMQIQKKKKERKIQSVKLNMCSFFFFFSD